MIAAPPLSRQKSGLVAMALGVAALSLACGESGVEPGARVVPALELEAFDPPAAPGAMAPRLAPGPDGPLLTWLEPADPEGGNGEVRLLISRLEDAGDGGSKSWAPPRELAGGADFFANWADVPAAAESGGVTVAHWLESLGEGPYAYGVQLARSRDQGVTWEPTGLLHDDDSPEEHGFVSWVALPDGALRAFWLDGREMGSAGGAAGEAGSHGGHGKGAMQLRTARVEDGEPAASELLDPRVCECCPTDAAMTSRGPVVVYRGRSEQEIRDIWIVRRTGEGWSAPSVIHRDGWEIHGCPVNGPAVAADGDQVAVAWFTGAQGRARVRLAFSEDGGESFGPPVEIDSDRPLGRVGLALAADGGAFVSWMAGREDGAELRLLRVDRGRARGEPAVVTATTAQRSAGVPRMIRHREELLFVWVEDEQPSRLRAAAVATSALGSD